MIILNHVAKSFRGLTLVLSSIIKFLLLIMVKSRKVKFAKISVSIEKLFFCLTVISKAITFSISFRLLQFHYRMKPSEML